MEKKGVAVAADVHERTPLSATIAPPPHVILLPYPAQGHINPMLQFAKRLVLKGIKATLITTIFISKSSPCTDIINSSSSSAASIQVKAISDGFDEGGFADAESIESYLHTFETFGSKTLAELIISLSSSSDTAAAAAAAVNCIIYDPFLPWALNVGKDFGLVAAPFFTQSCFVSSIYYHIQKEPDLLTNILPTDMSRLVLPGENSSLLPAFELSDMPSYINTPGLYPAYFEMVLKQYINIDKADWIFINTFRELEPQVVDWMATMFPLLRTIGPTIPSMYLDKQIKDDRDYGFNLYNLARTVCLNWLNSKPTGSVVYVSFGSMASLDQEQMEEIVMSQKSLIRTTTAKSYNFLWVVKAPEEKNLPKDFFKELSEKEKEQVLVVRWSPQLEVLSHEAVGCFVTHCGWNSTLEALSLEVPMVGIPLWTDQTTNAKFVQDVWGVGVRATTINNSDKCGHGTGIVTREEIERCIRKVMEGERAEEIQENARKWSKLAKQAVDVDGSSDRNIDEFVAKLIN